MNRRNFLKAFTGAAVGAAVMPYLPPAPEVLIEGLTKAQWEYVALADKIMKQICDEWMEAFNRECFRDGDAIALSR